MPDVVGECECAPDRPLGRAGRRRPGRPRRAAGLSPCARLAGCGGRCERRPVGSCGAAGNLRLFRAGTGGEARAPPSRRRSQRRRSPGASEAVAPGGWSRPGNGRDGGWPRRADHVVTTAGRPRGRGMERGGRGRGRGCRGGRLPLRGGRRCGTPGGGLRCGGRTPAAHPGPAPRGGGRRGRWRRTGAGSPRAARRGPRAA